MNFLSRSTDYAIRALVYMAKDSDRVVSTADLDRNLRLPRPFMRKTLQQLQKAGYLSSLKGVGGGFRLDVLPSKIKLIELMKVFQGDLFLGDCFFRKKLCSCVRTCPLHREIRDIEAMVIRRLSKVTLKDLIN